jgi:Tfp pilus assembly protein PilF
MRSASLVSWPRRLVRVTHHRVFSLAFVLAPLACGGAEVTPSVAPETPPSNQPNTAPDIAVANTPVTGSDDVSKGMRALENNDATAAKAYFDHALKTNPKDSDALYYEGVLAEKAGDKDTAEKSYKGALKVKPDLEQAAVNLSALYVDAQRYDEALAVTQGALGKHGDNGSLHLNAAVAFAGKGDQAGATKEFESSIRLSPDEPMYKLTYGHWLGSWKQGDLALVQLRAARPAAKKNGETAVGVLAAIGHEMHVLHAWSDCVPTYDEAILLKDAAELRTERAACKIGAKDSAGAMVDLQAAVARDAAYAPAHYYLAGELARGGQFKDAAAQYEAFLKLEPTGPMAKSAQDKLKLAKQRAQSK